MKWDLRNKHIVAKKVKKSKKVYKKHEVLHKAILYNEFSRQSKSYETGKGEESLCGQKKN